MRVALLLLAGISVLTLGVGCCHHKRRCYDSRTGLVRRGKLFDTCRTGNCCNSCDNCCDDCGDRERWYDTGRKRHRKSRDCDCDRDRRRKRDRDCNCRRERRYEDDNSCGCDSYGQNGSYVYPSEGALIPYEGTYVDGGMVYDGQVIYDGAVSDCPTCNTISPTPTYAPPNQPYPELQGTPQQQHQEPNQAPPMDQTSVTIPPASYSVPVPLGNGPALPQLERIGAF